MNKKLIIVITILLLAISSYRLFDVNQDFEEEIIIEAKSLFQEDNYIQGPHDKIYYSTMDGLKIQNVDYCRKVTGSSMQPTLFTNNIVCFTNYKPSMQLDLREGMIVLFDNEDKDLRAVHRIKALYKDYLLTQGDNTLKSERIDYEDIEGIAVAIILT